MKEGNNHRRTTKLTSKISRLARKSTSKQRGRSELIRNLTYIDGVCKKMILNRIRL